MTIGKWYLFVSAVFGSALSGLVYSPLKGQESDSLAPGNAGHGYENLTPAAAKDLIDSNGANPDFIVLDVRTPEEYGEGHLGGALNMDSKNPGFQDSLAVLDRTKIYLVYCRVGNRSTKSAEMMVKSGFASVYNMLDGIRGWIKQGFSVGP